MATPGLQRRVGPGALAALLLIIGPSPAVAQNAPAPLVFFDIAAPDLQAQRDFYSAMFGWQISEDGSLAIPTVNPLPGALRVEPSDLGPITERVLYFGVEDIEAAQRKATELGGGIAFPRLVVPGVAILALLTDPAGNRFGVVEIEGGEVVIPPSPSG